jgi:hypothetical protein
MKYLLILVVVALVGCAAPAGSGNLDNGGSSDGANRLSIDQLGRTPLPVGAKIRGTESLIFGVGENWVGRAVLELPSDVNANYSFFADQFPRQGWNLVTAVRGKHSLLVFTRADRSATIEMDEGGVLGGITASITMSPTGASMNPAPAAPGVVVQPVGGANGRR